MSPRIKGPNIKKSKWTTFLINEREIQTFVSNKINGRNIKLWENIYPRFSLWGDTSSLICSISISAILFFCGIILMVSVYGERPVRTLDELKDLIRSSTTRHIIVNKISHHLQDIILKKIARKKKLYIVYSFLNIQHNLLNTFYDDSLLWIFIILGSNITLIFTYYKI